jgi:hypothetical protein
MSDENRAGSRLNTFIEPGLRQWLEVYCQAERWTRVQIVNKAIELFRSTKSTCPRCRRDNGIVAGHGVCANCVDAAYDHITGGGINSLDQNRRAK